MSGETDYATEDYRWTRTATGARLSYKETLIAMAAYFGRFNGRWHSNAFWRQVARDAPEMDEATCEAKVREIERDADAALENWRRFQ